VAGTKPTVELSFRIALGSAICGVFVFFTAEYARLRGELIHAESQLNLSSHGQFVTSQLGRQVRSEAFVSAFLSSAANFLGALFPLCLGSFMPRPVILAVIPSLVALGLLGLTLAHIVKGRAITWVAALVASGVALSVIGVWLHIA
jgi:predicted membrane protein (TIGR00267 family)